MIVQVAILDATTNDSASFGLRHSTPWLQFSTMEATALATWSLLRSDTASLISRHSYVTPLGLAASSDIPDTRWIYESSRCVDMDLGVAVARWPLDSGSCMARSSRLQRSWVRAECCQPVAAIFRSGACTVISVAPGRLTTMAIQP